MILHINGVAREITASTTVHEMVEELSLPAPMLLIEHNGVALQRSEWGTAPLADGDRVEILRVAAGG